MPGSKCLVGRKEFKSLRADTFEILFNPKDGLLNGLGNYNRAEAIFYFYNGSIIFFKHFDDENALKGPTTNIIFIEQAEEVKKEVFDVLKTRNSLWGNEDNPDSEYNNYIKKFAGQKDIIQKPQHYFFITSNPYPCWLHEYFIQEPPKDWEIHNLPTTANVDNLPIGYIESKRQEMSDQEFNQYIMGSWQFAEGRIYNEFKPDEHIIKPIDITKYPQAKLVCAIDTGYQHYTGVLFTGIMPDGTVIIYDEIYEKQKTTDQIAKMINLKCAQHTRRPDIFLIDYAANKVSATSGKTESDIFRAHMIPVINADKEVYAGIMRTKSLFKAGKILISSICSNIIKELGLYSWDPKHPDQPIKANDDLLDPLRYIINKGFKGKASIGVDPLAGFTRLQKWFNSEVLAPEPEPKDVFFGL
jgi:phage terminase large subunit